MSDETLGLKLKADSSEWTAAFDKAGLNIGKLAQEVEKAKGTFDGFIGKLTGASFAFNQIGQAARSFFSILEQGAELAHFAADLKNLENHVPVAQLQMMQEATEGAVDKITLMRFAMQSLAGEMHVTEEGLEAVLQAANTLADKGMGNTMQNAEKLMSALARGSSRELREFKLGLQDSADKGQNVANILEKIIGLTHEEVDVNPQLKAIERFQTAWTDVIIDLKKGFGDVIIWFGETLINAAELVGNPMQDAIDRLDPKRQAGIDISNAATERARRLSRTKVLTQEERNKRRMVPMADAAATSQHGFSVVPYEDQPGMFGNLGPSLFTGSFDQETKEKAPKVPRGAKQLRNYYELGKDISDILTGGGAQGGTFDLKDLAADFARAGVGIESFTGAATAAAESMLGNRGQQFFAGGGEGGGEAVQRAADDAGMSEEFNKKISDRMTLLGGSFAAMSQGLAAAVDAAITGSDSIGKAFMKASAAALKAIAIEAAVKALMATAEGIYEYNPTKFVAAAKFAAVAIAAGAGAALLGSMGGGGGGTGGGGGSPSTPAGGGSIAGGSQAAQQGVGMIQVYVGDGFVGRPDELAVQIADKVSHGIATGRVKNLGTTTPGAVVFK